jgi:hypothetical protein
VPRERHSALDVVDRFAPMWLLIPEGFHSIVQKAGDAELCVRARDAGDLDRLRKTYMPELGLTTETPAPDYPSRLDLSGRARRRPWRGRARSRLCQFQV